MNEERILAELSVSKGRRYFGAGTQMALGLLLIYIAGVQPPQNVFALVALLFFGAVALWQGWVLWCSTGHKLVLTSQELRDTSGRRLARLDDIDGVDRGFFAFKPSNGFMIKLKESAPRAWAPGLWWRIGRRVGVGGTTSGRAAREMADLISVLLTDRGRELLKDGRDES